MGGVFSKSGGSGGGGSGGGGSGSGGEESGARNLAFTAELSSYEAACALDPDLESFDANLQVRTNRVVNSLALGVEARSLSFDSLREVTGCLLEMNQDVVRILLESKKDIWGDQQLFDLVKDYFENSLLSLDFCTALEKCLKRARDRQLILQLAIQRFEDDQDESNNKGSRTMEQLRNFKAAQDPFSEDFFQLFQEVYKQQRLMLDKLMARRQKMDKKIKSVTTWRRVSSIIFGTAFAALLICAVVAAAVAAPPFAAALATASSVPVGSMGKWFDSLWTKHETALKAQREVIGSMHLGTCLVIKDLDNIRVLVDRVENEMESLMDNVNFSLRDKDTLNFGMEEIKKNLGAFMKSIQDLSEHADTCSRDIRRARTVVLRRIMKHPTSK